MLGIGLVLGGQEIGSRRGRNLGEDEERRYKEDQESNDDAEVLI